MINKRCKNAFENYIKNINKPSTSYSSYSGYGSYNNYSGYGNYSGSYSGSNNSYYKNTSYYNGNVNKDFCTIFFYEWSDINSRNKVYNSKKAFLEFMKKCEIEFEENSKKIFDESQDAIFAVCVPNKSLLIVSKTWYGLEKLIKEKKEQSAQK